MITVLLLSAQLTHAELVEPPRIAVQQGRVVVLTLDPKTCEATPIHVFGGFLRCTTGGRLIVGVDPQEKTGTHSVQDHHGHTVALLDVLAAEFPSEHRPAPKVVPAPVGRAEADDAARDAAYRAHEDDRWAAYHLQAPLALPVVSGFRITDPFGLRRFYGKSEKPKLHTGADLAAPTPGGWAARGPHVQSIAPGVVVLAQELWNSGKTVIVYHGDMVYSSYSHLDDIAVRTGQMVPVGGTLGAVGSTSGARAVGAHLHFVMEVGDALVDPLAAIETLNRAFAR